MRKDGKFMMDDGSCESCDDDDDDDNEDGR